MVPLTSQYPSLFGVTNVQTFMYFQTSSRDPLYLKCIVSSLSVNVVTVAYCGKLSFVSDWLFMVQYYEIIEKLEYV